MLRHFTLGIFSSCLVGISVAEETLSEPVPSQAISSSLKSSPELATTTSWPVVILALLGIIGFILILAWAAKRFGGLSAMGIRDMKVVAAMPVGTRERVAIIDVKGQQFLVGITPHNISHIHTFDDPVVDTEPKAAGDFAQKLSQIMSQKKFSVGDPLKKEELGDRDA